MSLMHREQMDCCNYFKATGNEIAIDSKSSWMQLESIEGNTTQVNTTGAQLLQDSNIYPGFLTNANGTRTNDNNYRTVWLSLPIGTYTLSVPGGVMIVKTVIDGILNNSSTSIADGAGYTCTLAQDGYLGISFRKQDFTEYTEEPQVMLNTGSTALPWEPYTGGQPSPSPDYPQEIVNADIKSVTVKSAQMFDIDNPWQPYYSPQTISLTFTEPFRKVGDYADEITPTKKVSRCIEITLDGSENWSVSSSDKRFQLSGNLPVPMNRRAGFCNQYFVRTKRIENEPQLWLGIDNNDFIYIPYSQFYDESLEDKGLSLWKAHLATNPLKIITYTNPEDYVETPLDQSNVDAIKSLYAYNGVTLLNNNENTVMKVMYKSK